LGSTSLAAAVETLPPCRYGCAPLGTPRPPPSPSPTNPPAGSPPCYETTIVARIDAGERERDKRKEGRRVSVRRRRPCSKPSPSGRRDFTHVRRFPRFLEATDKVSVRRHLSQQEGTRETRDERATTRG
jgi:hypothetical protein